MRACGLMHLRIRIVDVPSPVHLVVVLFETIDSAGEICVMFDSAGEGRWGGCLLVSI